MKKLKITAMILVTVLILAIAGCGGMTATSENVGIDLSGVLSRTLSGSITTVKVWLVAAGTNNFVNLEQSEFSISSTTTTITLSKIPVGPTYSIYLSLGTKSGEVFTPLQTANGTISVAGGIDNSVSITAMALKTASPSFTGKNLKAVVYADGVTYAIDEGHLYYGSTIKTAAAGYKFNDLDLGINGDLFLSANADNGQAIVKYDVGGSVLDPSYSALLPGNSTSAPINILSSEVFYTIDNEPGANFQVIISQLDAGFVINILDESVGTNDDWTPIDISEMLAAAGDDVPELQLSGKLVKGVAVVEKGTESAWVYISTKVGNFRKAVSWAVGETVSLDFGEDFITGSVLLADRNIQAIDYVKRDATDYLFIGTDNGLYSATIPALETDFPIANEKLITATTGKRVSMIAAGGTYTACVTPLNLIIVDGDKTASIAFNEGLPATGLLNSADGITGLEWKDADTLLVSGVNGLVEVAANTLTYN